MSHKNSDGSRTSLARPWPGPFRSDGGGGRHSCSTCQARRGQEAAPGGVSGVVSSTEVNATPGAMTVPQSQHLVSTPTDRLGGTSTVASARERKRDGERENCMLYPH